jgi:NAD(P)-dependent dehydrogenase (short-subunit alcohol dehydrogenase family)
VQLNPQDAAFITGAASGIGFAMCKVFAEAGLHVAMADIDGPAVAAVAQVLRAQGFNVSAHELDVTKQEMWTQAINAAERQLGPICLLCNNAGISALGVPLDQMDAAFWRLAIDINLNGPFYGMRCVLPRMKERGRGHIVNTASVAALGLASAGAGAYSAGKTAVIGVSEVLQKEGAAYGVGVTVLCPGPVRSQLWRTTRRLRGLPELDAPPPESLKGSAAPDAMDPVDVAKMVLRAVREDRFWCITHPEFGARIRDRNDALEAAI